MQTALAKFNMFFGAIAVFPLIAISVSLQLNSLVLTNY